MRLFYPAIRSMLFLAGLFLWSLQSASVYGSTLNITKDSTATAAVPNPITEADLRNFPQLANLLEQEFLVSNQTSELTQEYLNGYVAPSIDIEAWKQRAKDAIADVEKLKNFVNMLTSKDLARLPVGLKKVVNNTTVVIAISQVKLHASYAELTAFAKLEIPQEPKVLYFGLEGIKLTYDGGIVGDAKLVLLGDLAIRINGGSAAVILKGGNDLKDGKTSTNTSTYLTFDCNGFKELSISADVEFPRSLMIPIDEKGKPYSDTNKRVKGSFSTIVSDWSDILVELSLPEFQIPYLPDVTFQINGGVLDLSDVRNKTGIFPPNYEKNYIVASSPELWRGVYASTVKITLPPQFKDKTSEKRVSFTGKDMLIDNNGMSGDFQAKNILPIEKGTASGWKFSVDEIGIKLEANNLTGASFKGLIGLPVAEKDTFTYEGIMMPDDYTLTVGTKNKLDFSMWKANVQIDPNSWVKLHLKDDSFKPEAMLNGRMSLSVTSGSEEGKTLGKFNGIEFKELHITTEIPYLEVEYFGYAGEVKFADFPVSLEDIGVKAKDGQAKLYFTVKLNLMESQFGATTRFDIKSALKKDAQGNQSWKYDGLDLSKITINATISGSLKIAGSLEIRENDPVWGNGIAGSLQATFIPIKIEVKSRAIFGSKGFRYWFVDGSVSYGDGFPVIGPLKIHGFGGGAFYHMKRNGTNAASMDYIPDEKTHYGIKAAVLFNVVTRATIDGEASFEIGFSKSFGINFIGFFGDAKFLGKLKIQEDLEEYVNKAKKAYEGYEQAFTKDNPLLAKTLEKMKTEEPSKAAEALMGDVKKLGEEGMITAHVGILMDFAEKTFHSTFDVYVNVAGGLLKGIGKDGRAGWSVIHIGQGDWYTHMGTPVDRIGLQFGLGSLRMKTSAYFMTGSKVLDSPPPPQAVADMLGIEIEKLDYMRDLNALADGRGFAFGTDFSVSTGDIHFMILYAKFQAGAGFDIMLRDYGNAHCEGSSDPIGIDGWYANGQAYAYLEGEVGVSVKLFGFKKKFSILRGGSAVLLQAKLPAPTVFKGYLAVKVDVLGGLVSGSFRLKISLGDDCHIVNDSGSPLVLNVISDVKPMDKSTAVDVFAAPQVAFNMRVDQPFFVDDDAGTKTYRIKLEEFKVTDNGEAIPGKLVWNSNNDIVTFYSTEVLPPQKELKAKVLVNFEIKQGETWQIVYDNGKKAVEEKEVSFTTGTAPDYIPLTNIEYAYPVVDQRNYYRDESTAGYVQLKRGQSYLFPTNWKYEIRVGQTGKASDNQTVSYNVADKRIDFTLPKLDPSTNYIIGLVATPTDPGQGQQTAAPEQLVTTEDGEIAIKNNQAAEVLQIGLGKSLIDYTFHSSKHARFADKVNALVMKEPFIGKVQSDVINLQPLMASYEPFDLAEINGTTYTNSAPLVLATAIPDDAHYTQDIYPMLYREYPVAGNITLTHRDTTELGLYPRKAMPLQAFYVDAVEVTEITNPQISTRLPYIYDLTRIYQRDFIDLQAQIVNRFLGTPRQNDYAYIIMNSFPKMRYGAYKAKFQYVLPNGSNGSSGVFSYFNPIK